MSSLCFLSDVFTSSFCASHLVAKIFRQDSSSLGAAGLCLDLPLILLPRTVFLPLPLSSWGFRFTNSFCPYLSLFAALPPPLFFPHLFPFAILHLPLGLLSHLREKHSDGKFLKDSGVLLLHPLSFVRIKLCCTKGVRPSSIIILIFFKMKTNILDRMGNIYIACTRFCIYRTSIHA